MPKHSNNLQKWILKSESDSIEKLILELENKYPLELVVAFTDRPAVVPFAAARMIALLALSLELLAEIFWWPIPAWIMGLTVFAFLMIPVGRWQSVGIFRTLSQRREKEAAVAQQAEECFNDLGLARTKTRNALLVFFNMKEKIFHLCPDNTLQTELPELKITKIIETLSSSLNAKESPGTAVTKMLEHIAQLAHTKWPEPISDGKVNELPNALAWWE